MVYQDSDDGNRASLFIDADGSSVVQVSPGSADDGLFREKRQLYGRFYARPGILS